MSEGFCQELAAGWIQTLSEKQGFSSKAEDFIPSMCHEMSHCPEWVRNSTNPVQSSDQTKYQRPFIRQEYQRPGKRSVSDWQMTGAIPGSVLNANDFGVDAACQLCQWATSAIEAYLSQETTETELARILTNLCTALPPGLSKTCSSLVSVYLTEVLVYMLDRVTPPVICNRLLQCS